MTTYSYSDTTPMMMGQVNVEAGMPATGYAGGSVWTQQPTESNADFSSDDLRTMHSKGYTSLILSIVTFIGCFFCCPISMICNIPAMLFAAKSRVSAEKKDYYESKAMLHWSYILTFAGCFLGWVLFGISVIFAIAGFASAGHR